jgi:general secretion pathway protein K
MNQRGFVLAMVLWLLALLSLLGASFSLISRTETALTVRSLSAAQARAVAESGIWLAVRELARPASTDRWPARGESHALEFPDGMANVRLQDETGKIDLNSAHVELLYGLLLRASGDGGEALSALQSILDWRDSDDVRRKSGAESAEYADTGHVPRNGPFTAIDELRLVHGMSDALYERLLPALTIYSGQAGINPDVAVREALLSVPGVTPGQVDGLLSRRGGPEGNRLIADLTANSRFMSRPRRRVVSILSEGRAADARVTLEAVVRLGGGTREPYSVLSWREGQTAPGPVAADADTGKLP